MRGISRSARARRPEPEQLVCRSRMFILVLLVLLQPEQLVCLSILVILVLIALLKPEQHAGSDLSIKRDHTR